MKNKGSPMSSQIFTSGILDNRITTEAASQSGHETTSMMELIVSPDHHSGFTCSD